MQVTKRDGSLEDVQFDKITERIRLLTSGLQVDPVNIARMVCSQIMDKIQTSQLDELSANICASLSVQQPDYDTLGARILITNHEKQTRSNYVDVVEELEDNRDAIGDISPLLDRDLVKFVRANKDVIRQHFSDCVSRHVRYEVSLFGWRTLYRSYLLKANKRVVERIEHLFYRVALFLHYPHLEKTEETYARLIKGNFIHATPTLFHAGTKRPQMSSCFGKNTVVDTLSGPKPICSITPNDEIVTHTGSVRRVKQIHKNLLGDRRLAQVFIYKTNPFHVTEDHKLYVHDTSEKRTYWKAVSDLSRSDFIMIPNYKGTLNDTPIIRCNSVLKSYDSTTVLVPTENGQMLSYITFTDCDDGLRDTLTEKTCPMIPSEMMVSDSWMKVVAVWLMHGFYIKDIQDNISGIGITLGDCSGDDVECLVRSCFPFTDTYITRNEHEILISSPVLGALFYELFGIEKHIYKQMYRYPTSLIKEFVKGLYLSSEHHNKSFTCLTRKHIMSEIYTLCRLHNIHDVEFKKSHQGVIDKLVGGPDARHDEKQHVIYVDGCAFVRFLSRDYVTTYDKYVYTLGIEQDHSYSVNGIVAQNCFLLGTEDNVRGIYKTLSDIAEISKWAGGIGVHISNIRGKGSYIRGTNGVSNGIMPMLRVYNETSRYIDQGGGKRKGSCAVYLEPWNKDVISFVMAKRNVGNEDERARDLFYALWVPDLFMKRVESDGIWSLMCPDTCTGLYDSYGEEFEERYEDYEKRKMYSEQMPARDLWKMIIESQIETGVPYVLFKDSINRKSNQKNLGTIRSSNLCVEVCQFSDSKQTAVCNLASVNLSTCIRQQDLPPVRRIFTKSSCFYCKIIKKRLEKCGLDTSGIVVDIDKEPEKFLSFKESLLKEDPSHVIPNTVPLVVLENGEILGFWGLWHNYMKPSFDFEELGKRVEILVNNMNKIIDKNYYPTPEAKLSNMSHRPIGIGVQGLADLFCKMYIPFDSDESRYLNRKIFETMYYHALKSSLQYRLKNDLCYASFKGSPLSQGIFHFDMCENFDKNCLQESPRYDWETLRSEIVENGTANSLFLAPMPTASTSQILNQNECFEPFTSNVYVRRTLAGEFTVCNKYLVTDLQDADMWNQDMIDHFIVHKGTVQNIESIPRSIRDIYRTAWEIPQKSMIEMSAERQWFIDQSQSFNLFVAKPSVNIIHKMLFYGWKKGLKTGVYYVRTKQQNFSQNFTVDPLKEKRLHNSSDVAAVVQPEPEEPCESCSA